MKTVKRVSPLAVLAVIILLASACAKDNSSLNKSSRLAVNLATVKSSALTSAGTKGSAATNGFTLNSVKISIADLIIEENSGNDVEQQGNYNDGGSESENKNSKETDLENADIKLPGPYSLDVVDGKLTIDQVSVYPGTFKKVDFTFLVSNDAAFGGNSIVVKGSYQKPDGTVLPLVLKSDFSQQVQLQLANGGIVVASNSSAAISIVLDIPSWINSIDLSSAVVTNNEIMIDKTINQDLLKLFEANLASSIEVED